MNDRFMQQVDRLMTVGAGPREQGWVWMTSERWRVWQPSAGSDPPVTRLNAIDLQAWRCGVPPPVVWVYP